MRGDELKELLVRKPFVPLRLHMTDGTTFDIRHPDNIIVLKSRVDIGVGADARGVVDRVDYCSLLHVVRIEELQSASAEMN